MKRIAGWILYPRYVAGHSDNAFGWLIEEAAACNIDLKVLFTEELLIGYRATGSYLMHKGVVVEERPDFVLIRTYDSVISRFFEQTGIPVINSTTSMELCKNKMLTHELLCGAGIPTPSTVYMEGGEYDYQTLVSRFGNERFIIKRIDGAKGEDVFLIRNDAEMHQAIGACDGKCICQEFIEASYGRDVRVWVIGEQAIGAVLRYSETSFLSNFSQGGKVKPFELPADATQLALNSAKLLGIEFAGIDLLFTKEGFTVNEINGNSGFRTLSQVGDNPIPKVLFSYIVDKYIDII